MITGSLLFQAKYKLNTFKESTKTEQFSARYLSRITFSRRDIDIDYVCLLIATRYEYRVI